MDDEAAQDHPQPIFYYDLGRPDCYLAAERIITELRVVPEWEPVLGVGLVGEQAPPDRRKLEQLASDWQLQPFRWPAEWPPDTRTAMLAATYAKRAGRVVAFSLAAFRQAFAAGRDLGDQNTVLLAAAASEMHPSAVLKAVTMRSIEAALTRAGERATAAGVDALPAIEVGDRVFAGDGAVQLAAAELAALRT